MRFAPFAALPLLATVLFADTPKAVESRLGILGVSTRCASESEKRDLGLGRDIQSSPNGVIVERLAPGGPAESAGLSQGDAILALDENRLYSDDDLQDFDRTLREGQRVKVVVLRGRTKKEESLEISLAGRKQLPSRGIEWQFAGVEQFPRALALAKKEGRPLMVGLSGAEAC